MFILVSYDIREEKTRRRVRALLRRYSLVMLTYSTYIGRGNRGIAERLAKVISKMLEGNDRAVIILLHDFQYELLLDISPGRVRRRGEQSRVWVFAGE